MTDHQPLEQHEADRLAVVNLSTVIKLDSSLGTAHTALLCEILWRIHQVLPRWADADDWMIMLDTAAHTSPVLLAPSNHKMSDAINRSLEILAPLLYTSPDHTMRRIKKMVKIHAQLRALSTIPEPKPTRLASR